MRIYISSVILFFLALPHTTLIITYEIIPIAIPSEILYIKGIAIIAIKQGIVSVISSKSSLVIDVIIRKPTTTSAGAVANDGIARKTGDKKSAAKKSRPVMIAVRPVRPPSSTPEALSI